MISFQKTFIFAVLSIILLVGAFFITTPQASAADCTIESAKFMGGVAEEATEEGWFKEDFGRLIHIQVNTTDCAGQDIKVSLEGGNPNTGAGEAVDELSQKPFTVPTNDTLDLRLWASEEKCTNLNAFGDFDCSFFIRVWTPQNTTNVSSYASHDKTDGLLQYNCDGTCSVFVRDWTLASPSNNPAALCNILGASFSPHGTQPAGYYSNELPESITASIQTNNCVGQTIKVSIIEEHVQYQTNPQTNAVLTTTQVHKDYMNFINKKPITVPLNETINMQLQIGNEGCGSTATTVDSPNCKYHIEVINPIGITITFKNLSSAQIGYDCSPDNCVPRKNWILQQHNGVDPETGETVYAGALPGPTLTEGDPCVLGTGDDLSFEEDCYALLAPIGNIKEIKGDITLGSYINILVGILIGIATLLSVVMIVVGGVQYMTTDALSGKSNARETITKALLGLLLALGSFLILKTINPQLLIVEPNIPDIYYGVDSPPELNSDGTYSTQDTTMQDVVRNTPWIQVKNEQSLTDIRPSLPSGVTVNNDECENVGDSGCTSMYFTSSVAQSLLTKLAQLRSACDNCNIVITGGSEFWEHRTHGPSRGILDFSVNPEHEELDLEDIFQLNEALSGQSEFPGNNTEHTHFPGFTAKDEPNPNHWHVF